MVFIGLLEADLNQLVEKDNEKMLIVVLGILAFQSAAWAETWEDRAARISCLEC